MRISLLFRSKLWLAAAASVAILLSPASALAATQSITISPTSSDKTIQPGSSVQDNLVIVNSGSDDFSLKIYATPYSVTGEDYQQHFTALPGKPNIMSWFHFQSPTVTVPSNQSTTIPYTLTVPANTPSGGYYATVFAETQPASSHAANGVVVHERVGSIFYLQVGGNAIKHGSLDSWQVRSLQTQPLTTTLRVKNDGDVHFPATINLTAKDIFGKTKFRFTSEKEILPRTIREITTPWTKTPPVGVYKLSGSVTYLGQTKTLPSHYVIVMAPMVRVILVIAVVILIALLVLTLKGRRAHRKS